MCKPDTTPDTASESYVYDPSWLSRAQRMGDACAVCHTKWPRPRRVLGEQPDGSHVYGCDECAGIIGHQPVSAGGPLVAAR
ncbi:hypothetical protein GCM10007079_11030 [Nocardiopsis terrae]|uniref:Recombination endonuclease VII n=1 Tax=Nocardiopsis terrae TaxID=372655 RepID=A0ABR9HCD4_9ACTN|nr:hypothetical protein [Nocardiopsis terrae]MBE1456685.1 hypothetical protein [Nocardiopsis terrae]GHC75572.1 hypothetical protein GCM10007079_11030 [Nocardiopsis terrae]